MVRLSVVLFLFSTVIAQNLTGPEIITKINDLFNQNTQFAKVKMTIETTTGDTRTFEYDSWSMNGAEKTLIRYSAPPRVKNQAILMLNHADDIWSYFPRTNRVRKLATHAKRQKMQGSDFSYEDMGDNNSFVTDYVTTRLKDETLLDQSCYKLELVRRPDYDTSYKKLIIWARQQDFAPLCIEYYENENSPAIKRLWFYDIKAIQNIPTSQKMVMKNLQDQSQTVMEMDEVKYHIELDPRMFSERGMKQ